MTMMAEILTSLKLAGFLSAQKHCVVPPLKFQAPPSCQPLIGSTFDLKIPVESMTSQSIAAHNHRALNF